MKLSRKRSLTIIVAVVLTPFCLALTFTTRTPRNTNRFDVEREPMMATHATGTFEVKLTPQDDKSEDKTLGRMTIEKQWHGGLEGTSKGQMLTAGDVKTGSAGYVAMEKFSGTVNGRKGTFILQHMGIMTRGKGDLTVTVVPESGTGELTGISGKLSLKIENGKHFYDFEYAINQNQ